MRLPALSQPISRFLRTLGNISSILNQKLVTHVMLQHAGWLSVLSVISTMLTVSTASAGNTKDPYYRQIDQPNITGRFPNAETLSMAAIGDVNRDFKDEVVAFYSSGEVRVAYCNTRKFVIENWEHSFTQYVDWGDARQHPRFVADVDGDGRDDLVGLYEDCIFIALAQKSETEVAQTLARSAQFGPTEEVVNEFGSTEGWGPQHQICMVDINGDNRDDIVGFGNHSVYVSYASSYDGVVTFLPKEKLVYGLGNRQGFASGTRRVVDYNQDGSVDLIGVNESGDLYVAFGKQQTFANPKKVANLNYGSVMRGGCPREFANINNVRDGLLEVVDFRPGCATVRVMGDRSEFTMKQRPYVFAKFTPTLPRDLADNPSYDYTYPANKVGQPEKDWSANGKSGQKRAHEFDRCGLSNADQALWITRTVADLNNDERDDLIGVDRSGTITGYLNGAVFVEKKALENQLVIKYPNLNWTVANGHTINLAFFFGGTMTWGRYYSYANGKVHQDWYFNGGWQIVSTIGMATGYEHSMVWGGPGVFKGNAVAFGMDAGIPVVEVGVGFYRVFSRDPGNFFAGEDHPAYVGWSAVSTGGVDLSPVDVAAIHSTTF